MGKISKIKYFIKNNYINKIKEESNPYDGIKYLNQFSKDINSKKIINFQAIHSSKPIRVTVDTKVYLEQYYILFINNNVYNFYLNYDLDFLPIPVSLRFNLIRFQEIQNFPIPSDIIKYSITHMDDTYNISFSKRNIKLTYYLTQNKPSSNNDNIAKNIVNYINSHHKELNAKYSKSIIGAGYSININKLN